MAQKRKPPRSGSIRSKPNKRSQAAKLGWQRRKEKQRRKSQAARKGWLTRRLKQNKRERQKRKQGYSKLPRKEIVKEAWERSTGKGLRRESHRRSLFFTTQQIASEERGPTVDEARREAIKLWGSLAQDFPKWTNVRLWGGGFYYRKSTKSKPNGEPIWETDILPFMRPFRTRKTGGFEYAQKDLANELRGFLEGFTESRIKGHHYQVQLIGVFTQVVLRGKRNAKSTKRKK